VSEAAAVAREAPGVANVSSSSKSEWGSIMDASPVRTVWAGEVGRKVAEAEWEGDTGREEGEAEREGGAVREKRFRDEGRGSDGVASELGGCPACALAVNWPFFLRDGRGFGGMRLRRFSYVFILFYF
jgi:hypothetical protein